MGNPLLLGSVIFVALLAIGWQIAGATTLSPSLGGHFASAYISFALLVVPIWFFGFGIAEHVRQLLSSTSLRVAVAALFATSYAVLRFLPTSFTGRFKPDFSSFAWR